MTPQQAPYDPFNEIRGYLTDYQRILNLVRQGRRLFMIVGLPEHGKSHFMRSLVCRASDLFGTQHPKGLRDRAIEKTERGEFYGWQVKARKRVDYFWDISGEDFENVRIGGYPVLNTFLAHVLPKVNGITLNIALKHLWAAPAGMNSQEIRERSEQDLEIYKIFLRALIASRFTGVSELKELLGDALDLQASLTSARSLDLPVLVNFAMADRYVPENIRPPTAGSPVVDPETTDPLRLAERHLPSLVNLLADHARWFKFAFTQAKDDTTIYRGVGCEHAYEFLTSCNWRGWPDARACLAIKRMFWG